MTRYRAAPADALIAVQLENLTAVYHRISGQTHLLAEPAPQILELLADQMLSLDELMRAMEERYALADGSRETLAARLTELCATGLVEAR